MNRHDWFPPHWLAYTNMTVIESKYLGDRWNKLYCHLEYCQPPHNHAWKHYYRLQRGCGKVMFLHLSVILFTGGGGWLPLVWGCVSATLWADTPRWADPPWQTPPPPDRHPLGRHPQADTPWADTPLGRHPPQADTSMPSTCWDTHLPPLRTACWDTVNKPAVRIPL